MKTICTICKPIAAPQEQVFRVFSDIPNCAGRIKSILRIEMLTPGPVRLGSRFKETRKMFGKECTETMEVTAFEPSTRYEIGGHSCGMIWSTEFRFSQDSGGTLVEVATKCEAQTFFAKIMNPLTGWMMKGAMKKCIEQDLNDLAEFTRGLQLVQS